LSTTTQTTDAAADARRLQMLAATIEVIVERGFPETRIADVAERAGVSPALVIYYFKTKDQLLTEAMRHSEDGWYAEMARRTESISSATDRLEEVVSMTCHPGEGKIGQLEDSWAVWLDLWAQSLRDAEVGAVRREFDEHFRETIRQIVRDGVTAGEFSLEGADVDDFAVGYTALLDGFAIQIALSDPVVTAQRAFDIAMRVAAQQLGFSWKKKADKAAGRRKS
jgi:AcrR family transcriptional regulator